MMVEVVDFVVYLGGGFKHFLFSPRNMGKIPKLTSMFFQMGWFDHQLDIHEYIPRAPRTFLFKRSRPFSSKARTNLGSRLYTYIPWESRTKCKL